MQVPIPLMQSGLGGLGPWELGVILVIVLVIFGAGKLPQIGSSLGQAIKNFKKAIGGKESPKESEKDKTP